MIQYTPMSGLIQNPRLYSPLYVCLVDQDSHEVADALYNYAAEYCEDVKQAMTAFHTPEYPGGDLMRCFTLPDDPEMEHAIRQKVKSARLSARPKGEFLYAELGLDMTDDLTVQELEAFVEQIESQYKDGIGAELERHDFPTASGGLICFRLGHDELVFMTGTAFEEMRDREQEETQKNAQEETPVFMPVDGKSVEFSIIMLCGKAKGGGAIMTELYVGGTVDSRYVAQLPEFQDFAKYCRPDEPISVDNYAYVLYGNDWDTRKATKDEIRQIVTDDFPENYEGNILRPISHAGPMQFKVINGTMYDRKAAMPTDPQWQQTM